MTTRNLQITIFEAPPGGGPADRSSTRRGGGGSDPGENYVKPPPDDPTENYVKPPPDDWEPDENYVKPPPDDWDPGENYVKPPPDDPSGGGYWSYGSSGAAQSVPAPWVTAQYLPAAPAQGGCGCSPCCEEGSKTPERPCIAPGDHSGFLIVRLAEGVGSRTAETLWQLAQELDLDGLRGVLEAPLAGEPQPDGSSDDGSVGGSGAHERLAPDAPMGRRRGKRGGKRSPREEPVPEVPWPPDREGALRSSPLILLPGRCRSETVDAIVGLEGMAARTSLRPRYSLTRYWRVDLRPYPERVADVLDGFNELAEVDLAYRELRANDTAVSDDQAKGDALADDQGYFDSAPMGIGARWLKERFEGETPLPGLTVIDLEQGWTVRHEELRKSLAAPGDTTSDPPPRGDLLVHGENRQDDEPGAGNHGTAVLGQLAAAGIGPLAVEGSAARFAEFRLASHYRTADAEPSLGNPFPGTNGHVASAIVSCLIGPSSQAAPLGRGDVLLLEIQRGRLPTETDEADFDAIRLAVAIGVIVVEAAGNGNYDLDRCGDPQTGRTLYRGGPGFADSGAILVGAAFSDLPHDRAPFSSYGSRVDCYGWGEGVTTCGYGDLHDGGGNRDQYYTNTFNGTSSAAPVIAGAASILQCLHELRTHQRLMPLPMRSLLASRATGTPQGPNVGGHIGVMPDLEAIVRGGLQLVPDLYVRRDPCEDGARRGPDDVLSSSPDLVVLPSGSASVDLGEGSASAHHPAPGVTSANGGDVYLRMRNRGLTPAAGEAWLFASPAATLVTPDDWTPIAKASLGDVPVGDRLQVSGSVPWDPTKPGPPPDWPSAWPADTVRAWSLLAVFERDGGAVPTEALRALPPGSRWFDWRRYLAFLRGPGVAWRNIHPIPESAAANLGFYLAGTPDRTREFTLEVIQRLPEQAQVTLHVPPALASHLRQRQPGLGTGPGLSLPRRHRIRFSHVRLPRTLCAPARFEVTATQGKLEEGHSLAIRQLWRGEEVGRVTWYVTRGVS